MDSDFPVVLSTKLAGLALFVYGFIVFADEGASELIDFGLIYKGNAVVVSPYIWGSSWGWPGSGVAASQGLLIALTGFFILCVRWKGIDLNDIGFWTFRWAFFDTLVLFFAWCLTWTVLLTVYQPGAMSEQFTDYLSDTGITNTFVMYSSAAILAFLSTLGLRNVRNFLMERWRSVVESLLEPDLSKRSILSIGLLLMSIGAVIFVVALSYSNPWDILDQFNGYFLCDQACYFRFALDFFGWVSSTILMLVGAVILLEKLFPREPSLW